MGTLESPDGQQHPLRGRVLMGRDDVCDLVLTSPSASAHHASLRWNAGTWQVKDLASRNGTYILGHRLNAGTWTPLSRGQAIELGSGAERWELVDDGAPAPFAETRRGHFAEVSGGFLALPPEEPVAWVCPEPGGGWVLETESGARVVENREQVRVGPATWTLALPEAEPGTAEDDPNRRSLDRIELRIRHSHDEETVSIDVCGRDGTTELRPRAHSFMVLTLARLRERDRESGCDPHEAGWIYVDELERMLRVKPGQINLLVFRARRQLADAGVVDSAGLVERRPGTTQLRLGSVRFTLPTSTTAPSEPS